MRRGSYRKSPARGTNDTMTRTSSEGKKLTATVLNIQRMSTEDGPGIRTTVFFKGCGLACAWCHNPESVSPQPEIGLLKAKCRGCGQCAAVCPTGAHVFTAGMGAEAVLEVLKRVDLDEMRARLKQEILTASGMRRKKATKRLRVVESLIIGVLGTIVGVVAGRLLLEWLLGVLLPSTFPDIGMIVHLSAGTLLTAALFGVVAVALAPVLTLRRLRRMDIPSTLRVME